MNEKRNKNKSIVKELSIIIIFKKTYWIKLLIKR